MKLQVGKSYILSTINSTILKKKVKVVGLLTYEESQKVAYNTRNLAINEKVLDNKEEDGDYLASKIFYKLVVLSQTNSEEETDENILVWDDIIDSSNTTELNVRYELTLTVDINPNADILVSEIMKLITDTLLSSYETDVESTIKVTNTSSSSSLNTSTEAIMNDAKRTKETLEEAMNTLVTLINLKNTSQTIIDKINELNVTSNINEIGTKLDDIQTNVALIYRQVK